MSAPRCAFAIPPRLWSALALLSLPIWPALIIVSLLLDDDAHPHDFPY